MASEGLKAVEQTKSSLSEADYRQLHDRFLLAWYVARAYRLYMELSFPFSYLGPIWPRTRPA